MELIIFELFIIFMLFLRELGIPEKVYMEIYTNPTARKFLKVFGDVLYMIGGSIIAAVIYAYVTGTGFYLLACIVGFAFVVLGAYLRK